MFVQTEFIPLQLPDKTVIQVAARVQGAEEEVGILDQAIDWGQIETTVTSLVHALTELKEKVQPDKFSVEFGIQVGGKSGQLTALLVEGSASGSFKFTLEWGK